MNLVEFFEKFPDEKSCEDYLIAMRYPDGFVCEHCGNPHGWYLKARRTFQCTHCNRQKSITAGTIFHSTKIPLQEWFLAMHLVATNKKGISALNLQRQLPKHNISSIRELLERIKKAMSIAEEKYMLVGEVEIDDAFFGGCLPEGKRGKGSENKKKVEVMVSVNSEKDYPEFVKMKVVEDLKATTLSQTLENAVAKGSHIISDGYAGYTQLEAQGYVHTAFTGLRGKENQAYMPWVNIMISNAKRFLHGTHHSVQHLQTYLDEFCWRYNKRFTPMLEKLVTYCIKTKPAFNH